MTDWNDFRSSAGVAANITSLAFRFADLFKGKPQPELHVWLSSTGGGTGVGFTAGVSETANKVPAMGVHLIAELGEQGVVYEAHPFNMSAGQIDREVRFSLERPRYGTLVKECNDQVTLYGDTLTVTAVSENGGAATASWTEELHEPGSARYEAMKKVWDTRGEPPALG